MPAKQGGGDIKITNSAKADVLRFENIGSGWLYFYVHFVTEVVCFFVLGSVCGDSAAMWIFPLIYDALAFVPQSIFGHLTDKFPKLNTGIAGCVLMSAACVLFSLNTPIGKYTAIILLCMGNCCTHISGAQVTLRCSNGKLSHSAVFVSGGSFGVITGKLLASNFVPFWIPSLLVLTGIPFVLLAEYYRREADEKYVVPCKKFHYANVKLPAAAVIAVSVFIIVVRGYMGYGIPTSWKKTVFQTVMLYVAMGTGKALGGIFADLFGVKKTALFSAVAALPFLLLGDRHMTVSLVGVMFFSMTMPITLALLVSVLQNSPGLAFGFTTIGLFLGTVPVFFFRLTTVRANCIVIAALSALCIAAMLLIIGKDGEKNEES